LTDSNATTKRGRKKCSTAPPSEPSCGCTGDTETEAARLRAENETLRRELAEVLANASENEKIWRHFAAVERLLFRMRELDRLAEELLREISIRFQTGLLVLYISHPEIQERIFQGEPELSSRIDNRTWISPLDGEAVRALFGQALKPVLFTAGGSGLPAALASVKDSPRGRKKGKPKCGGGLASGALIPLNVNEVLFGALLLGSSDPDRYHPGDGTDLLERLGANIALSLDNCLTYEKVRDFSVKDQLTGFFNFFQIHSVLEREFRKARRSRNPLSVLIVDLNFVHDWEDFEDGKELIKHAAGLLQEILPKEECYIGRYGSDEFLAVLPNIPGDEAREVLPYISATMRKSPFKYGNTAILITAAIGVGTLNSGMICPQDLVDAAYAELCTVKGRQPKND
jgi:diguanylate cyclase (GGDEF)-like protein